MSAPTLVAVGITSAAVNTGVNVTTPSLSWQTGDVVVVLAGTEGGSGGETLNAPTTTGAGLTFTQQQLHNSSGTDGGAGIWTAVASSSSSGTISFNYTHSGATGRTTLVAAYVWRGSAGVGNSAITATPSSTRLLSLTPTAADGGICWIVVDWNADAVQSFSPAATSHNASTPGPSATPFTQLVASTVTYYVGELDDQTSAGAVSYGIGGANAGPFTIAALEVQAGAGGGGATATPGPIVVPMAAAMRAATW